MEPPLSDGAVDVENVEAVTLAPEVPTDEDNEPAREEQPEQEEPVEEPAAAEVAREQPTAAEQPSASEQPAALEEQSKEEPAAVEEEEPSAREPRAAAEEEPAAAEDEPSAREQVAIEERSEEPPAAPEEEPSADADADAWERILPRSVRDSACRVVEYPKRGWARWKPILLDQLQTTVQVFFWLVLVEGFVLETAELVVGNGEVTEELWFASTVYGGRRPYRPGACYPTFFDELFSNAVQAAAGVLGYLAGMAYGHATARVLFHAGAGGRYETLTIQFSTPTYGTKTLDLRNAEYAAVPAWRTLLGVTQRAEHSLWVGSRHWVEVEETGHLDDRVKNLFLPKTAGVDPDAAAADGFGVNRTNSYRAFPEWELVYCGDGATRARLEAAIAAINQSDGANLCCPRLCPNACCVQPCQSPPPWIADVFEDHEARLGAAEGDALDVWRAPLFSVWLSRCSS